MSLHLWFSLRTRTGVLLKDMYRYRKALNAKDSSYLALCNRYEKLEIAPDGSGYRCNWRYTSDLHAPKCMPTLGLSLLKRALADHPIRRLPSPAIVSSAPELSFIIGHRGMERWPNLLATLESIAGQKEVKVECLVIEQDQQAHLKNHLPSWVRHLHTPPPVPNLPYCRAWAFNVGVHQARAPVLVLHDNDMLVPADYAARILQHVQQGSEVMNIKRFIFFLDEVHTKRVLGKFSKLTGQAPEAIMQNAEGGGSIAITRNGYERIGGFDETFIGWGGEDNEFWERAQTLRVWPYGYLPLVHLWHPSQPGKHRAHNPMLNHYRDLSHIEPTARIEILHRRDAGLLSGPFG